jgi:hypothetical protein
MSKSSFRRTFLGVVAAACILALSAVPANASHVACGATITQNTVLDSDLTDCPQDGLKIGADGITLDLDGHTIDGRGGFSGVSNDGSYDGITIRDGRVKQFEFAVDMYEANDVTVSGLIASEIISHAVLFVRSNNCVLRRSISYRTGAGLVNPLESTNCLIEHNASFSTGANRAESIFLFKAVNATVRWNWVSGAYRGIHLGTARNNTIKHNFLWGNVRGIEVFDSTDSHLLWNAVTNSQESGIHIWNDGVLGTEVFGTRIIGNLARRNGDDGIHVDDPDTFIARNWANRNADLGIQAVPGVTDGGANRARFNGNPAQCTNVAC